MITPPTTYLDRAVAGELAELQAAEAGRNNTLLKVAARLYTFSAAGVLDETFVTDTLTSEARALGLGAVEIKATLKSAQKRAARADADTLSGLREKCSGGHSAVALSAPTAPESCDAPNDAWQVRGRALMEWAKINLWASHSALGYLLGRGLSHKTISAAEIGYNPAGRWSERAKWGLGPDQDGNTRMWLPAGIVIPWFAGGALWKLTIRRATVKADQERYKTISGSANALYNADALQATRPAMLVEGVFDAVAVQQTAGDKLAVVASGTSGARRVKWLSRLALCSEVLISLDADSAGDEASRYWCEVLPNARRHRPYYADPAQMLQDDQDVRAWVLVGLGGSPVAPWATEGASGMWAHVRDYWREEVAVGSGALERLACICQERGYDYAATMEALCTPDCHSRLFATR